MNAIETINQFVEAMISSQTKFQDIKAEVDRRNHEVEECISGFQSGIREVMRNGGKVKNAELQEIINRQLAELENLLNIVAASLEATQKGMKFIHEYEDSFNIAVFGKVKAGKSYTGNFIMGNVIRDMGIHTSYDKLTPPTVTVIDRGKKFFQFLRARNTVLSRCEPPLPNDRINGDIQRAFGLFADIQCSVQDGFGIWSCRDISFVIQPINIAVLSCDGNLVLNFIHPFLERLHKSIIPIEDTYRHCCVHSEKIRRLFFVFCCFCRVSA